MTATATAEQGVRVPQVEQTASVVDSSPAALLTTMRANGLVLTALRREDEATLRVWPSARLTPEWREAIRTHKQALLALLIAEQTIASPPPAAPHPAALPVISTSGGAEGDGWLSNPPQVMPWVASEVGDPRPELAEDTAAWRRLLRLAFIKDGDDPDGVFGVLHCVRCCGARLVRLRGAWRIVPGKDYFGGRAAWIADRTKWLLPRRAAIAGLLASQGAYRPGAARGETADEVEQP
jgi:hypothetical protein